MPNVWWLGPGHERIITPAMWADVGITGVTSDTRWHIGNGFAVDEATLNASQLAWLADDAEFAVGKNGPRTGYVVPGASFEVSQAQRYYEAMQQLLDDMAATALVTPTNTITLTNKTLTAPVINGTVTGTYTLAGTPTLTNPRITTIHDANGVAGFGISGTVNAVNYLRTINSIAGARVVLGPIGTDTDIGISITPKGAGQTVITQAYMVFPRIISGIQDTNGATLLGFTPNSNAVNYVNIWNRSTGISPTIEAAGSDVDIDLLLRGKGTGRVTVNGLSATSAILTAPRLDDIRDTNGNRMFLFSAQSGAVDYFQTVNAVGALALNALGTSTNINVALRSKGTGYVDLADSAWAPILRAIPAASAANYWVMRSAAAGNGVVLESAGVDANVPLMIKPKGTSPIWLANSSNQTVLRIDGANTSVVNYVNVLGAVAGAAPAIQAAGEANSNLTIAPAGTGRVNVTNLSATGAILTAPQVNGLRDTNNVTILGLNPIASAVNYLQISNAATGGELLLRTVGNDTDIPLAFRTAGIGAYHFRGGDNTTGFSIVPTAGAVNRLIVVSSVTGVPAALGAAGSDANIGIQLSPKGAGVVQIYAATGQTPTIQAWGVDANVGLNIYGKGTGRVTITNLSADSAIMTAPRVNYISDINGFSALTVNATANAVNGIFLVSGAAGSSVSFRALGSDTDIPISLFSKGTGVVSFRDGAGANMAVWSPIANAVNYFNWTNAAAGGPLFTYAVGSDTNISMTFAPKGNGSLQIYAYTGQTPTLQAAGADATVGLTLASKNSGNVALVSGVSSLTVGATTVVRRDGTSTGTIFQVASTGLTAASGLQQVIAANPVINQSGTAGYYGLVINPTETSLGTGEKFLLWLGVAGSPRFRVDNQGSMRTGASSTALRPAADSVLNGSQWYDTTLGKPIWSNGTNWRDAMGNVV